MNNCSLSIWVEQVSITIYDHKPGERCTCEIPRPGDPSVLRSLAQLAQRHAYKLPLSLPNFNNPLTPAKFRAETYTSSRLISDPDNRRRQWHRRHTSPRSMCLTLANAAPSPASARKQKNASPRISATHLIQPTSPQSTRPSATVAHPLLVVSIPRLS